MPPKITDLTVEADLFIIRRITSRKVRHHVDPDEKRYVASVTNEAGYFLYEHYRTAYFSDAASISDDAVAASLGWTATKVAKYRRMLEKEKMVYFSREGSVTRVLVGLESVVLHLAGLPPKIENTKAFNKLKRKFGVSDEASLLQHFPQMVAYYKSNPTEFL